MSLSEIHNYYEDLVENYIDALELNQTRSYQTRSSDYLSDLYCLALNQLPVHYIRHGVDMYFYMSDEKRQEMEEKVIYAVTSAISWLDNEEKEKMREKQRLKSLEHQKQVAEEEARLAAARVAEAEAKAKEAQKLAEAIARQTELAKKNMGEATVTG